MERSRVPSSYPGFFLPGCYHNSIMGSHLLTIHGHRVTCDDDRGYYGVKHLAYKLSEEEVLGMFRQAETEKEVEFEDDDHRKFTLVDGENGSFVVVATNVSHGWF